VEICKECEKADRIKAKERKAAAAAEAAKASKPPDPQADGLTRPTLEHRKATEAAEPRYLRRSRSRS